MAEPRVEGAAPHTQHTPPEGEGWPRTRKSKQKFFGLDLDDDVAIPVSLATRWDVDAQTTAAAPTPEELPTPLAFPQYCSFLARVF